VIGLVRSVKGAAHRLARACGRWWGDVQPTIRVAVSEERTSRLKRRRLHVMERNGAPAFGQMLCPCGCSETLNLRFFGPRRPRWSVAWDPRGRPTVRPSIWRQSGCRSHFHLTRGRVEWC